MTWLDRHPEGSLLEYLSNAPTGYRSTGLPRELNISIIIGIPTSAHFWLLVAVIINFLSLSFWSGRPVDANNGSRLSKDATGPGRD